MAMLRIFFIVLQLEIARSNVRCRGNGKRIEKKEDNRRLSGL